MTRLLVLFLPLLAACATAQPFGPVDPPPLPPAAWLPLLGAYRHDTTLVHIVERNGQLHLWRGYYVRLQGTGPGYTLPASSPFPGQSLTFVQDADGRATALAIGGARYLREALGPEEGNTFQITPVRPVAELRRAAKTAQPPAEAGPFRTPELVELVRLDPSFRLDIRYATTNNFMGTVLYEEARAFLQQPAAEALVRVQARLKPYGVGLLLHDAYRPWWVTKVFWDATPDAMKEFVANPAQGSRHNRGCAVDLTLYDLRTGAVIAMPSGYDEFSPRAYADYPGGTTRQRWYRTLLRAAMEAEGFEALPEEWWHFDYRDWRSYPIQNMDFSAL
jgi:D-alanyl-D-alanine dipeptidase